MSVIEYDVLDLFTLRIVKYLSTNPANKWVNSYEFAAGVAGGTTELLTLINAFVGFEAALHADLVTFDRAIMSTWQEDSVPYDPTAFLTVPLTQTGLRTSVGIDLEPIGMAWRVNRVPVSGRVGNLFYRGVLFENEVYSPAGGPVLSSPAGRATLLDDAIEEAGLDDYLGADVSEPFSMAMVDATGSVVRSVISLVSDGVSLIKADHMWFNRSATP